MNELKILAAMCRDKSCFSSLTDEVGEAELGMEGMIIVDHVRKYYDRDDQVVSCDMDLLKESIFRSLSNPKHRDKFEVILTNIGEVDTSALNVVHEVLEAKRRTTANNLAIALNNDDKTLTNDLISEYVRLCGATDLDKDNTEHFEGYSVADLVQNEANDENRIKVLPLALNALLKGGAKRGHNLLFIARPEIGKTAFAVNMARGFLAQGLRVLYLGNEDPGADIVMRIVSAISGMTEEQVKSDPAKAQQFADAGGYQNLVLHGMEPGTLAEIRMLADEHQPDVIILDQARHVKTGDESKVQSLEAVAVGMRAIAKKMNLLSVMITQAGESAAGKLNVYMEDLADNKTGMQGAVDLFVGIGADETMKNAGQRRLTLSKNKIGHVHDWVDVPIIEQLSRYG